MYYDKNSAMQGIGNEKEAKMISPINNLGNRTTDLVAGDVHINTVQYKLEAKQEVKMRVHKHMKDAKIVMNANWQENVIYQSVTHSMMQSLLNCYPNSKLCGSGTRTDLGSPT